MFHLFRLSLLPLVLSTVVAYQSIKIESECYDSLDPILSLEESVQDDSQVRTYILCPHTIFHIASSLSTQNNEGGDEGDNPILIGRSNMHVLCGSNGASENDCILEGGAIHCGFFDAFGIHRAVKNALIQGITFVGASSMNVWLQQPGDLTLRDCIFKENHNVSPIYVSNKLTSSLRHRHRYHRKLWSKIEDGATNKYDNTDSFTTHLLVTECVFMDNIVWHHSGESTNGLVTMEGNQTVVEITNSIFAGTKLESDEPILAYIIANLGGQLILRHNCFLSNHERIAPVFVTQKGILHTEFIFLQRQNSILPPTGCAFASISPDDEDQHLSCVQSDSAVCTSTNLWKISVPCTNSLAGINMNEVTSVHNDGVTRTYILCPLKTYMVDEYDDDLPPLIMGRSNVRLLCGADGKVENECTIHGGANQLRIEDPFQNEGPPSTENIHVQGITFSSASLVNVVIAYPGDIVFTNCQFKDNKHAASIYIDPSIANGLLNGHLQSVSRPQQDLSSLLSMSSSGGRNREVVIRNLTVKIMDSLFWNNELGGVDDFRSDGPYSYYVPFESTTATATGGLITNHNATLYIQNCIFRNNKAPKVVVASEEHVPRGLIANFGGSLILIDNCFDSAKMFAPVMSMLGTVDAYGNLGSNGGGDSEGGLESWDSSSCDFIAMFTDFDSLDKDHGMMTATCVEGELIEDESCSSSPSESPEQVETIQPGSHSHSGSVVLSAIECTRLVILTTTLAMTIGACFIW